jgi:hypothetical protein
MATFTFWYSETYTNKGWFTADNEDEARKLLEQVQDGELSPDDLPDFGFKDKGYELDISPETLDQIEETN